jgi:ligand-binding sensor domain-containing protein
MMRSLDQGDTWQPLPGSLWGEFYDVDVHPTNPDRLYAATWSGVWVFDGIGWTIRDEHHGLERDSFGDLVFQSIAVDPTHPEVIYAGQNESWRGVARGIFRSTDGGSSWKNINLNFGHDLTVRGIAVSPHDGTVWLGTDDGNWKLPPGPYAQ